MEPHASNDLSSKWKLMKPCFPRDLGTQRCRFSPKLLHSLNVHVGNYVLVNLNTHWTLCCVYVWKNQNADCFQVDETVSLPLFQNGTRTKDPTSPKDLPQFTVLDVEPLKKISLTLVVRKYSDIAHSIQVRSRISDGLRDVLELYGVLDGCVIDCHHLVPCYLLNVCYVIVTHCHPRCLGKVGKVTPKTAIEIVKIMSKARYEALRANSKGIIGLGGLDKPRKLLHDLLTCPFRHRDDARRLGLLCPRGILLIGPPGTGKTSLVRAVVNECNASLVYLPGPIVCKPQPGESESVLRAIFGVAQELSREGPCVLFLDEVDSILANRELARGGNQHGRLLAQMLTLMDSVRATENLVIVGATNRPDVLDPAVRRPGRFDQEVRICVVNSIYSYLK